MIVAGLILQILFFGYFMIISILVWTRLTKAPTTESKSKEITWVLHMSVLVATSLMIFIRSIFRTIEYVQGPNGYLLSHEMYLYVFDAALMAIVVIVFNIVHPSRITSLCSGGLAVRLILKIEIKPRAVASDEEVLVDTDILMNTINQGERPSQQSR
jgi:hypothetical protein